MNATSLLETALPVVNGDISKRSNDINHTPVTPPKDSNNAHKAGTGRQKGDWIVCIFPLAAVDDRPLSLDFYIKAMDTATDNWRMDPSRPQISNYEVPRRNHTYGGMSHLRRQNENMVSLAHSVYLSLCMNIHWIGRIHFIAAESGAYMAVRIIEFIDKYGTDFKDDLSAFGPAWAAFLLNHELGEHQRNATDNTLSPLIRCAILIQPSLPTPSGMNRLMWSWMKPGIYDHFEWTQPTQFDLFSAGQER